MLCPAFCASSRSISATPEEVANLVVYTCSTQASATTGAALRVDGGVLDSLA
ncbi:SDR family oxidoreductase [Pseudomonas aeruginosa]